MLGINPADILWGYITLKWLKGKGYTKKDKAIELIKYPFKAFIALVVLGILILPFIPGIIFRKKGNP